MLIESIVINQELPVVYWAFANLHFWKSTLNDVLDVKVPYDDGYNKEYVMTVERPLGQETIRGIFFCQPNKRIEMFQPVPPPTFSQKTGVWTFESCEAGTRVVVELGFEVDSEHTDPTSVEKTTDMLRGYLERNLNLFKTKLETATTEELLEVDKLQYVKVA